MTTPKTTTKKPAKPLRGLKPFRKGLNIRLFQRIADFWLAEPRRLSMATWGFTAKSREDAIRYIGLYGSVYFRNGLPPCNTVGCIGGTAAFLANCSFKEPSPRGIKKFDGEAGRQALGLKKDFEDNFEYNEADRVFLTTYWPSRFSKAYMKAASPRQQVKVTIARIEHFITTGK